MTKRITRRLSERLTRWLDAHLPSEDVARNEQPERDESSRRLLRLRLPLRQGRGRHGGEGGFR